MSGVISSAWHWLGQNLAEIVAVSALLLTSYQATLTRRHNKISVRPHLAASTDQHMTSTQGLLSFAVSNNGLGPAIVNNWSVFLNNTELTATNDGIYEDILKQLLSDRRFNYSIGTISKGYVMPSNEVKNVLKIAIEITDEEDFEYVRNQINSLDLLVEYESMYRETFRLDTREQ